MMLYKIALICLLTISLNGVEHVYLKTPNVSRENIIGTNVGIRPYRKTGIRLEAETVKDKLIIHNYGYGGSGITLSFGGANEVLEILAQQKIESKNIAVLGAGVVGMTTAYTLLEQGYTVSIYSDNWSPNLTSNVAAGIWSPLSYPSTLTEDRKALHQRMLEVSEKRFSKSLGSRPEFAGIKLMSSYSFKKDSSQEAIKTKHRGDQVIVHFDNGIIKNGRRTYEIAIDGKLFMEDLYSKVQSKGAVLQQRHFETLQDILKLEETVIINCMSMGAREIFNDQDFIPARGQIIYYKPQEGIDYLLYQNVPNDTNYWVSIYPWSDRFILGGVYQYGEEELTTDPETLNNLIDNAEKCLSENL